MHQAGALLAALPAGEAFRYPDYRDHSRCRTGCDWALTAFRCVKLTRAGESRCGARKLLAAQARPTATEAGEVNALVIGNRSRTLQRRYRRVRFATCAAKIPVVPGVRSLC